MIKNLKHFTNVRSYINFTIIVKVPIISLPENIPVDFSSIPVALEK